MVSFSRYTCIGVIVCFFSKLSALEKEPWLYSPYHFYGITSLGYNYFTKINQGDPYNFRSNNVTWDISLLAPFVGWDAQLEMEFWRTHIKNFGFESIAFQARKQFWDDVIGDPVSLTGSIHVRFVPDSRLEDVVTPYHGIANFEVGASVGKEFTKDFRWAERAYFFAALGQADNGSPWVRFSLNGSITARNFIAEAVARGYFGTGGRQIVNVRHFHSYAHLAHRSIDLGLKLAYKFLVWGKLEFSYFLRVYAHSYPLDYQAFILTYSYPFGF